MQPRKILRPLALLLSALLCGDLSGIASARDNPRHDIEIVATDDSEATRRIVVDLQKKLPSAQLLSDPARRRPKGKNSVYITVGPTAFRSALAQGFEGVIISTFTSSQAYHAILDSADEAHSAAITAVYAEPSPAVQLSLITMLYKRPTGVAVILSNKTSYLEPILRSAAAQSKTEVTIEKYANGDNLNRVLNRVAEVPTILATPDNTVYNADNIRNILVTAYGRNQSIIGFSASLVKAGALASSFSDIDDIDAQVDELIADFETTGKLPDPQFPRYFSVVVNEDVARSLNIVVDESVKKFSRKPPGRQP